MNGRLKPEPNMTVKVVVADLEPLTWAGDVEFSVADGVITVYDYGLRNRLPVVSGLVFSASPGEWKSAVAFENITQDGDRE